VWSRNGRNWTDGFLAIAAAVEALPADVVPDGEAVAPFPRGFPDFHALRSPEKAKGACLLAFDLLFVDGADLRQPPLCERRGLLRELLEDGAEGLRFSDHMDGSTSSPIRRARSRSAARRGNRACTRATPAARSRRSPKRPQPALPSACRRKRVTVS
jgi:ATP-dependent DNA ligase